MAPLLVGKTLRCPVCGQLHDLADLEPTRLYPDAYLAIPEHERGLRAVPGSDQFRIRDIADTHRRYFLRVTLPIPVRGDRDCHWGVWVELDAPAFARVDELWTDPDQAKEPPLPATLANDLPALPPTLGLPGTIKLTGPTTRPTFHLSATAHPLATEQRDGIPYERVTEYLLANMHNTGPPN